MTGSDETDRTPRQTIVFAVAAATVALLRLYFCARTPVQTDDLLRHVYTALYVLRDGLGAAFTPLARLDPALSRIGWSDLAYNYPPLALGFFTAVVAASPTVFAVKVAITLVEALNAWLIARITESRWLGLLVWASPVSIWWASGESQFEPVQAVFMLAAIAAVRRSVPAAFAFLALAVQAKLTAVFLLPWLLAVAYRQDPAERASGRWLVRPGAAFAAGLLPSVAIAAAYPLLSSVRGTVQSQLFNPYFWDFTTPIIFNRTPVWLIAANAVTSWAILGILIRQARRSLDPWAYAGAILFVVFLKGSPLAQFWYVLLVPAFLAPIPDRRLRMWLIALTPLLDLKSTISLLVGPFGLSFADKWAGIGAFTPFHL